MTKEHSLETPTQRALLVALDNGSADWEESLLELERLAETAGVEVVGTVTQKRRRPDPVHFFGKGKAEEIRATAGELRADLLLVDGNLSPNQQRHLESDGKIGVLDRTALILDIFAQRARSKEGKLQVELAQLTYLLPRLSGKGTELSRLGGGIGTRGPGETKLETDRRHVRERITNLKKEVERVAARRNVERRHRHEAGMPIVAIVGYTNAGKSTLLNALSGADIYVEDLLFATLDPTTRQVEFEGGRVVLFTDTVGFIRNLPTQLINAFHATLEEAVQADVLVHVIDASHPQMEGQIEAAARVLGKLGCAEKPTILAFNKADMVADRERLAERREQYAVALSATTGEGLEQLRRLVAERLEQALVPVELLVPWRAGDLLSEVHSRGRVLSEETTPDGVLLSARVPEDVAQRLKNLGLPLGRHAVAMPAHLLYHDFFRFLTALGAGAADPWVAYEEHYLAPHRAVLEAWWEQVIGRPHEAWVDRVRQVRPPEYGLLEMVVQEGDLAALAQDITARCQAVCLLSPEPEVYFLVGFFSPDAFTFRVGEEWAIGVGLERLHSQRLLPVLLAHEYLHCLRKRRAGAGRVMTLGARMAEEGMAIAFTGLVFPERAAHEHLLMRPGQAAVMQEYEARLWEMFRPLLASKDEELARRVLYGQDEKGRWPSRSGMYLGWRMAQEFLEHHPAQFEAPAEEVVRTRTR